MIFNCLDLWSDEYWTGLTCGKHEVNRGFVLGAVDWGGAVEAEEYGLRIIVASGNQPASFIIPGDLTAF